MVSNVAVNVDVWVSLLQADLHLNVWLGVVEQGHVVVLLLISEEPLH
jgi:hypothetical protein